MPNSKANKIAFLGDGNQPILNLTDDLPKVYSDFKTVDKINAPYINDMVSPLYCKTSTGVEYTYDTYNNRYNLKNGALYRNDVYVEDIQDVRFEKEDVTEQFKNYIAFDVNEAGQIAYVDVDTTNRPTVWFNNRSAGAGSTPFTNGVIIASRVRIFENNHVVAIVCFQSDTGDYYMYYYSGILGTESLQGWRKFAFKQVFLKTANHSSDTEQPANYKCDHINPLINICKLGDKLFGVSILPYRGILSPQNHNGFYSFFLDDKTLRILYEGIKPSLANIKSEQVTTAYSKGFLTSIGRTTTGTLKKAILNNGTFYKYDNDTKGAVLNFPTAVQPVSLGYTVVIDSIVYNVYSYTEYTFTTTVNVIDHGPDTAASTFTVNGTTQNTGVVYSVTQITLDPRYVFAIDSISVSYRSNTFNIPSTYWSNSTIFYTKVDTTSQVAINVINGPNVFLDDGKMVSSFAGRAWDLLSSSAVYITETAYFNALSSDKSTFTWTSVEQFMPQNDAGSYTAYAYCSASRAYQQNFYINTGLLSDAIVDEDEDINKDHYYLTYSNSNCSDIRFNPGTRFGTGAFTSYIDSDGKYANSLYPIAGYRTSLGNGWNICINPLNGTFFSVGLSYSESDSLMGTLLTDWLKISDSFYIIARKDFMIYRDSFNRTYKISKVPGATLQTILDNRYVIINTTSYYNAYDSQNNRLTHYATDYNARALAGAISMKTAKWVVAKEILNRLFMTSINAIILDSNEVVDDNDRMPSWTLPIQKIDLCDVEDNVKAFKSEIPYQKNAYIKGIGVYYGNDDLDPGYYQYSISTQGNVQTTFSNPRYKGTSYPISSENSYYAYGSPSIMAKYINGIGTNDYIQTDQAAYPLRIYNSNQVVLSYNILSQLQNVEAFFILQGQYYGVIGSKIFSVTYYNGQISEIGTIVDINGFKFIGNTPTIAFFWSEKLRAIYSFTGDANMQLIWSASRVHEIIGDFYYDESTHSIFIPSSEGLIVVAELNVYMLPEFKHVTSIQFTKNEFHVVDDGNTYDIKYYKSDGYDVIPVQIETGFFGTGDKENITIDRWSIMLYNRDDTPTGTVLLSTSSLTDKVTDSDVKTLKIDKTMWSKSQDGDAVLYINYNPKLVKGQGIKLKITAPWPIAAITPHVADYGKETLTKVMR